MLRIVFPDLRQRDDLQLYPDQPYLLCPRRYRHRYLDGWREKGHAHCDVIRASLRNRLAAFFAVNDAAAVCFGNGHRATGNMRSTPKYDVGSNACSTGIQLLERSVRKYRIRIPPTKGAPPSQYSFCQSADKTSSCLTTMQSGELDRAAFVFSSGKHFPPLIQRNRRDCWRLARQLVCYFSDLRQSPKVAQECLCASGLLRIHTFEPLSATKPNASEFGHLVRIRIRGIESARVFLPQPRIRFLRTLATRRVPTFWPVSGKADLAERGWCGAQALRSWCV